MICVYCGYETGDEYDEHESCVDEALEEELEPVRAAEDNAGVIDSGG